MQRPSLAFILALAIPALGSAQTPPGLREVHEGSVVELSFNGMAATPVGEFAAFVNDFGGANAVLTVNLGRSSPLALRFEGAYLQYGDEYTLYDLHTYYSIASFRAGPQITLGSGRTRLYAYGTAGTAYFATRTSAGGYGCGCTTTDFDDTALSLAGGAGLRFDLTRGHRFSLLVGGSYVYNSPVNYLRPGDPNPVRSEADFATFDLGLRFGF